MKKNIEIKKKDIEPSHEKPMRVIKLIEDDDLVRLSIGRFLSLYNFQIEKYASAEEAIRSIINKSGDIIITDFNLPGLNGLELTRSIRSRGIKTPIILISAIQGDEFKKTAMAQGIDAVFTKPLNVIEIKDAILKFLNIEPDEEFADE